MFKRVLVTGGAGFVGSHIIDHLVRSNACEEITAVDNLVRGRRDNLDWAIANGRVALVEGDIRDRALMAELMRGVDVLFHQAALRITHCAAEPRLALEVMINATYDLLECAVEAGIGKVIAASSASVYGQADELPTTEEENPYNNRTLYGAAKAFNEALLRSFNEMYGLNYVALRYFNVYGPRMDIHGAYTEVLIRWIERITAGAPPLIFGDGAQTMDFVHVEDIARANVMVAQSDVTDEMFNVASGTETSLAELARLLLEAMGTSIVPEYRPERRVNAVRRRFADVTKAREKLGFEASVPLEEGLRQFVTWWREQHVTALPG